ncbi:hypothetical protein J1N35_001075 [Gossypium stocksii]|uniref:Uncharacterized protein n=1 Tax=Gossypium stocksii TaxID=47602 RepID=A0A9D3WIA2_9ROSI|nr:hypothetical protein J1N35_001075 [Gossypium stocksii]
MVNFSRLIHTGQKLIDKLYVFPSQVKQVVYLKDPTDEGWYAVIRNTLIDLFDICNGSRDDIDKRSETLPFPEQNLNETIPCNSTQFNRVAKMWMNIFTNHDIELSSGQKVGRLQLFDITHRKKDGSLMTIEAAKIMEKLKDKRVEYEAIASSDNSVNLDDIDN